jgi:hypothetical protein
VNSILEREFPSPPAFQIELGLIDATSNVAAWEPAEDWAWLGDELPIPATTGAVTVAIAATASKNLRPEFRRYEIKKRRLSKIASTAKPICHSSLRVEARNPLPF